MGVSWLSCSENRELASPITGQHETCAETSQAVDEAEARCTRNVDTLHKVIAEYRVLLPLCEWNDERKGTDTVRILQKTLENWRKWAKERDLHTVLE